MLIGNLEGVHGLELVKSHLVELMDLRLDLIAILGWFRDLITLRQGVTLRVFGGLRLLGIGLIHDNV